MRSCCVYAAIPERVSHSEGERGLDLATIFGAATDLQHAQMTATDILPWPDGLRPHPLHFQRVPACYHGSRAHSLLFRLWVDPRSLLTATMSDVPCPGAHTHPCTLKNRVHLRCPCPTLLPAPAAWQNQHTAHLPTRLPLDSSVGSQLLVACCGVQQGHPCYQDFWLACRSLGASRRVLRMQWSCLYVFWDVLVVFESCLKTYG